MQPATTPPPSHTQPTVNTQSAIQAGSHKHHGGVITRNAWDGQAAPGEAITAPTAGVAFLLHL